ASHELSRIVAGNHGAAAARRLHRRTREGGCPATLAVRSDEARSPCSREGWPVVRLREVSDRSESHWAPAFAGATVAVVWLESRSLHSRQAVARGTRATPGLWLPPFGATDVAATGTCGTCRRIART